MVTYYLINHLSYSQVPTLAKRQKVEAKKDSASAQELLARPVGTYDESELCKLSRDDVLMGAAKRYRVDTEKRCRKTRQENKSR
jgi:hypothetical protein